MATTTKVSALSALTSPDGAEELLVNDGGTSKKKDDPVIRKYAPLIKEFRDELKRIADAHRAKQLGERV